MDGDPYIDLINYEKIEKIGSGGFSEVFKVQDKKTKKQFAAKVSIYSLSDVSESDKRNLIRELNIMAKIDHPNIVKFIGYSPVDFNKDSKPVIVTELVANNSLDHIIKLEKKVMAPHLWDDTRKLITIYGIASAMNFLHSHGIIHRDLKPANILMDENYYPKVGDFGLSKKIDSDDALGGKSTTINKGTPIYMAPEIMSVCNYTKAGDVYAFAMIVYNIICPFMEPYKGKTLYALQNDVVKGIRPTIPDSVPEIYKVLLEFCWHEDLEQRPSFSEIVYELKNQKQFITENVDENEYLDYIDYVEEYQASFDKSKQIKSLEERKQARKIVEENKNKDTPITKPRSNTVKTKSQPIIANAGIKEKIKLFANKNVMGAPLKEEIKKPTPAVKIENPPTAVNNNNTKETNNIMKLKARFEVEVTETPIKENETESKYHFQKRDVQNSDKSKDTSNNQLNANIKKEPPLVATNDKTKITETETKASNTNSNKRVSIRDRVAIYETPHNSTNNLPSFKKDFK